MNKSIVCAVLVKKSDTYLLVRKPSHIGPYAGMWITPGGHVETGESIDDCAARELYEETGIKATNYRRLGFADAVTENHNGTQVHMIMLAYLADYADGVVVFNDGELVECVWVTFDEAQSLPLCPPLKYFLALANDFDKTRIPATIVS